MKVEDQKNKKFFPTESLAMRVAGILRFRKLRWSLRRLHVPVPQYALVLEVGAGGNPYPRANVMLDAMESTIERNEQSLVRDRPLVLGLCEELPFKDKSFDFIIASHVLEHTDNPEKFLNELMRVGKAGYIETPEGWFEKMCAFTYHRLEVSVLAGRLYIRKKPNWKPDEIAKFWDTKLSNSEPLRKFLRVNPDLNHLRFYWCDTIEFDIVNPECDAGWPYPEEAKINTKIRIEKGSGLSTFLRDIFLALRRKILSQNARNRSLDVYSLLRCPSCYQHEFDHVNQELICLKCTNSYPIADGVPKLFPKKIEGFNESRTNA